MELEDNTEKTKEDQIQWIKGFCEESQATYIKRGPCSRKNIGRSKAHENYNT